MHTYTGDDVFDDVFLSVALQIATLYNLPVLRRRHKTLTEWWHDLHILPSHDTAITRRHVRQSAVKNYLHYNTIIMFTSAGGLDPE